MDRSPDDKALRPDRSRIVDIYGAPEDAHTLAGLLERLNYTVQINGSELRSGRTQGRAGVAIVIATPAGSIELCTALAREQPVILVSGRADFEFRLAAARAGVSALLRPPVLPIELSEWLVHFELTNHPGHSTSVVIVDDDWLIAELNAEILRAAGMTVDTVCDPRMALEAIEALLPDLVLMDLQMPGVDGVELARMIRHRRQFASLPIVFLSTERDENRQFEARRLGGDDFITKPICPEKLTSVVRMRADRARLLRLMIERDGLTGLFDHRHFKERLAQELERCSRVGSELSIAMVDIDKFKGVNDRHGHAMGDAVIRMLATVLTSGVRKIDIVGRYGGEEFGIIMPDTNPVAARIVLDRLRTSFSEIPIHAEGPACPVTFSCGIASNRTHPDMSGLIDAADQALYRAKAAGRNNVQVADSGIAHWPEHAISFR